MPIFAVTKLLKTMAKQYAKLTNFQWEAIARANRFRNFQQKKKNFIFEGNINNLTPIYCFDDYRTTIYHRHSIF